MLRFSHTSLELNDTEILKNISFSVDPREIVAIIGASGAGKSSLFRLLIGEVRPTDGDVLLDDWHLGDLSLKSLQSYRRQIGVVFQDFRLLPKKNAYENVAFALEVCGEEKLIRERVPELLRLTGLEEKKYDFPQTLSGGEKQRLSIARALVHNPKILIADEPTGNLDPKNSRDIAELFVRLNRERELTVFIATHDPNLVEWIAPRIIRLENGELLFDKKFCDVKEAFRGIL